MNFKKKFRSVCVFCNVSAKYAAERPQPRPKCAAAFFPATGYMFQRDLSYQSGQDVQWAKITIFRSRLVDEEKLFVSMGPRFSCNTAMSRIQCCFVIPVHPRQVSSEHWFCTGKGCQTPPLRPGGSDPPGTRNFFLWTKKMEKLCKFSRCSKTVC